MKKEFMLQIKFTRALNGPEQNLFWDKIVDCLKKIHAFGSGTMDVFTLEWAIEYDYSNLDEHSVKRHIAYFLDQQKDIISDFSFYRNHIVISS